MFTVNRLKAIVNGFSSHNGAAAAPVRGISVDSRTVKRGDAFFAVPGTRYDGIEFVDHALGRGAACAVSRAVPDGADPARIIVVRDPVDALAKFSADFFGNPSSRMNVVGITGTNGKTTVTYLLESIVKHSGSMAGVVGTINYRIEDFVLREGLTTPFPHDLQEAMAKMRTIGGEYVFMEVSSHGITQKRVSNITYDAGIFTNLSRDHLDYHGDMETYYQVKKAFFTHILPREGKRALSIVNIDSDCGRRLAGEIEGDIVTYGNSVDAQVSMKDADFSIGGLKGKVRTPEWEIDICSGLIGHHNMENVLASVAYAYCCGIDKNHIAEGVAALKAVPGRLERIPVKKPVHVFVDYAHSPDGLKNVLRALMPYKRKRMILVFGCGGDRDRGKRPIMGSVAVSHADITVITSDNPRTEDPQAIIQEIVSGCASEGAVRKGGKEPPFGGKRCYLLEPDRKTAIAMAIEMAHEGDVVVIAGKGHETYQIIGERKISFDDREIVRTI